MWTVIYGNYYPREVDSYWDTKEEAEAQAEKLAKEQDAAGLGRGMWEVEEVRTGSDVRNDEARASILQPSEQTDGLPN